MPKIVILGSCKLEPYEIVVPKKNPFWNTEKGYKLATDRFYPAIDKADVVIVWVPDGIGDHTKRDIEYAQQQGKRIVVIAEEKELGK